jgi:hypothetical protein
MLKRDQPSALSRRNKPYCLRRSKSQRFELSPQQSCNAVQGSRGTRRWEHHSRQRLLRKREDLSRWHGNDLVATRPCQHANGSKVKPSLRRGNCHRAIGGDERSNPAPRERRTPTASVALLLRKSQNASTKNEALPLSIIDWTGSPAIPIGHTEVSSPI